MEIKVKEGRVLGSFCTVRVTIPKDGVVSIKMPVKYGHFLVSSTSTGMHGCVWYRTSLLGTEFGGNWKLATSELTGTTGNDGDFTFSAFNGVLYIENRRIEQEIALTFMG